MYANGGIDSWMRSPWLGSEMMTEKGAGGDGRHLMVSWTTPRREGYEIVMARAELSKREENAAEMIRGANQVIAVAAACICVLISVSLIWDG